MWSSVFANDECISLSLCASWVCENDRESAIRRSSFFESDDWISLSLNASWVCENDRESTIMTVNRWSSCFESQSIHRDKEWKFYQQVNCRFSSSSLRHLINRRSFCFSSQSAHLHQNDLYNNHLLEALRHRLIKREIEITHTTISHQIIKSTNNHSKFKQNFQFLDLLHSQHDREILASLRFVCFSVCLLQRHSVSSLQWLVNLLQWNLIIRESVTAISMNSLQRHQKRMRLILYIFI